MRHKWTVECEPLTRLKTSAGGWENVRDPRELSARKADPCLLTAFSDEVQKAFPMCKFATAGRGKLWVYHPNNPLCMGWIGYDDFRRGEYLSSDKKMFFGVWSRTIQNNKYASYNDESHMVMSINLEVAVRNAKKYLRDYKVEEIAEINEHSCRNNWGETDNEVSKKIGQKREKIINFDPSRQNDLLCIELETLVATGYKFIHPEFAENVSEFLAAQEEKKEALSGRTKKIAMITVEKTLRGNILYNMATTDDISSWGIQWTPAGTFTPSGNTALPTKIAGQLSVLSMCEQGQWVDNVGYKASESCFYVVR